MQFDVFGMCNPLYDIQAEVTEQVLGSTGYQKGGMSLIDSDQQQELVSHIYPHVVNAESGGSGANTMIGIAMLGGSPCYTGKIGDDEHGVLYARKLRERGVTLCTESGAGATGICVVMVTPDAERTLCTYLGISRELSAADVNEEALRSSKYIYVTGYLWDTETQKEAVLKAMRLAKTHGVKVSMSLSDSFCVHRHREDFLNIAGEYVDLLIGNADEMTALTGTETAGDAMAAGAELTDMCAITLGGRGSVLRDGDRLVPVSACAVSPVDTTGAGDTYAAGLLYGLTHGLSLEKTGRIAAYLAANVVSKLGPRLDNVEMDRVNSL